MRRRMPAESRWDVTDSSRRNDRISPQPPLGPPPMPRRMLIGRAWSSRVADPRTRGHPARRGAGNGRRLARYASPAKCRAGGAGGHWEERSRFYVTATTTLPRLCPLSTYLCASTMSTSGYRRSITGLISPFVASSPSSTRSSRRSFGVPSSTETQAPPAASTCRHCRSAVDEDPLARPDAGSAQEVEREEATVGHGRG